MIPWNFCNDPTYIDNPQATEQALLFSSFLLNEGYRITGIGGSDSHILPEEKYPYASMKPFLIGDPTTYVYAESLTAEALKDGIRSGHVIISRDGFIDIQVKGESLLPGDTLTKSSGELTVQLERGEDSFIQWVVDGQIVSIDLLERNRLISIILPRIATHGFRPMYMIAKIASLALRILSTGGQSNHN